LNASRAVAARQARILVVDDERQNRQLLEVILEGEGYHVLTAASGREALEKIAGELPDLVLLDVMMPGMDGYQVASLIKADAATKSIPVILLTALDDRSSRSHGLSAGAEDFLTKPIDRAELCLRVRKLLRVEE
jgi:CheY-like chemotaxis protein